MSSCRFCRCFPNFLRWCGCVSNADKTLRKPRRHDTWQPAPDILATKKLGCPGSVAFCHCQTFRQKKEIKNEKKKAMSVMAASTFLEGPGDLVWPQSYILKNYRTRVNVATGPSSDDNQVWCVLMDAVRLATWNKIWYLQLFPPSVFKSPRRSSWLALTK